MKHTNIIIGILIILVIIAVLGDIFLIISEKEKNALVSSTHDILKNVYCSLVEENENYNLEKYTNYKVYNTKNTVYVNFLWVYSANSDYEYNNILLETKQLNSLECSEETENTTINSYKEINIHNVLKNIK